MEENFIYQRATITYRLRLLQPERELIYMIESLVGEEEPPPLLDDRVMGDVELDCYDSLGSDDKRTELLLPQIKLEEGTGLAQDNFRAETYKPNLPSLAQDLEPRDLSNIYELPSPAAAQETVETRVMRTMLGEKVSSEFFDPVADVLKLFIPYNGEDSPH